jgi:hypothetical protein
MSSEGPNIKRRSSSSLTYAKDSAQLVKPKEVSFEYLDILKLWSLYPIFDLRWAK